MRDYVYLWHDSSRRRVVTSGLEFRDLTPDLKQVGGLVLLSRQFRDARFDRKSRLEFIETDALPALAADDIYSYGDFCWADFERGVALAELSDDAIAELTFRERGRGRGRERGRGRHRPAQQRCPRVRVWRGARVL